MPPNEIGGAAGHFFGLEKRSRFDLNCPRTGSNCFQKPFVCRNTEGKNSNILVGELLELLIGEEYRHQSHYTFEVPIWLLMDTFLLIELPEYLLNT